ncbi:xanthine dehydrogenase family protein molybdopterin-binding subunit [Syntrophobacter fumaroxidans]|uniref:Aldehyde oxidase and xanthine dehydrogenase, molybdopterin binding n=1 Tax=Syntrophobacter fumaroxidans (strain DSM 10017 / MPOB) TaxID=335543 RepID=A0LJ15_SYNFM|nr:molybdopterin cofactor-binding domain-containing protein [Syntrophobacter fumaroxidans]ABK17417.1 aldehyde oxidase and xanthine dehydrogenase, molybdopterin binding [Syntrophobacter fumaroxidans MPOB]
MTATISRREFLRKTLAGAGFAVAVSLKPFVCEVWPQQRRAREEVEIFSPAAWVQVTSDNLVTVIVNKSEMGQGVTTSLPMIVAEELDADWDQVRFEIAPARERYLDPVSGRQYTGGSTSVRQMIAPLRTAGAIAREMLLRAAAETWKVPAASCAVVKGTVRHQVSGRSLTFGELCRQAARLPVPRQPAIKSKSPQRIVGSSVSRLDILDKIEGSAVFGMDVFVNDMLHASIARPPAFGAKPLAFDREAAGKVRGVRQVVPMERGIAVCADHLHQAWAGKKALNVRWSRGSHPELNTAGVENRLLPLLNKPGATAHSTGDCGPALGAASRKLRAHYTLPFLAHATMEPMNCTAHVRAEGCDIWAPVQDQTGAVDTACAITGLRPDQVLVYTTYLGGAFGRRLETDFVAEAVQLSKVVQKPVKVVWTREEDLQNDFYRPACACRIEAGLDAGGHIAAWRHKIAASSILERIAPDQVSDGVDPFAVQGLTDMPYEIPNLEVEYVKADLPVPVGFWRSAGYSYNTFAVESFMDELARAAGKDPVEFRLAHLKKNARATRLIEELVKSSGWGRHPRKGIGKGFAYHSSHGTHVAQVAEVAADEKKGALKILKVTCAVDCGTVISPDAVAAQMEGGIIFGLSAALKEEVEFTNGGVASHNFSGYEILAADETPEIEILMLPSGGTLGGIGAVGVPAVAPAIANAAFNLTGSRIRKLPLRARGARGRARAKNP